MIHSVLRVAALVVLLISSVACGEDWAQWRGPNRDCHIQPVQWPNSLDESHLRPTWRMTLQPSYSGPIVVGDRVFVTETRDKADEVVTALDRATGKELWKVEWPGSIKVPFFAASNGSWIRSTPASNGELLFVMGMREVLVAMDVQSGREVWRIDFMQKFGTDLPAFGAVSSPLLDGEFLYVQAAFATVKLRAADGSVVWRSTPEAGAAFGQGMGSSPFSSPIIATLANKRQIVVQSRATLTGIDLENGEELWSQPVPATRRMNILTPLVIGDHVFTSAHGAGTYMFKVSQDADGFQVEEVWKEKQQGYMSSPVLIGNEIYLHMRNQRLVCFDEPTGDIHWTTSPFGKYWSMIVNGERILALDETGELRLIQANPQEYVEISSRKLTDEEAWAHLAISDRQLFVRDLNSISAWEWE